IMNKESFSPEQRVEALSTQRAELLKLMLERGSRRAQQIRPGSRSERGEAPSSSAQQRLWFIDQLECGSAAYHVPLAIRLRGVLDKAALQRALDTIVERHEVLRTGFTCESGVPRQRIKPARLLELEVLDFHASPTAEAAEWVREEKLQEGRRPF